MRVFLLFCLASMMQLSIVAHESIPGYNYILQGYGITYPEQTDEEYVERNAQKNWRDAKFLNELTPFIYQKEALQKKLNLISEQAPVVPLNPDDPKLLEKMTDYVDLAEMDFYGVNDELNRTRARKLIVAVIPFYHRGNEVDRVRIHIMVKLLKNSKVPCSDVERRLTGRNVKDLS